MINILIVTHGNFGEELLKSAEIIVGEVDNVECISFNAKESYDELSERVEKCINSFDENSDIIAFTDMYGGTPFNTVTKMMKKRKLYHITGINLPLFIDIVISKNIYGINEIVEKIVKNGKKSIVFVNDKFSFD